MAGVIADVNQSRFASMSDSACIIGLASHSAGG
jgi:hypothetical protein